MTSLALFEKHRHWQDVAHVLKKLNKYGFKAYLAGGCVRDALMGRAPNDFDIATDAEPAEVAKIFKNVIEVGRAFGVMIIPFGDFQIEVATFRSDGQYLDGRHPDVIHFSSPKEDALRRDFTINALFYDIATQQITDYVGGEHDIQNKVIRAVGDPQKRFTEDKLRMLRAARFASQLEFEIADQTLRAIVQSADQINVVSKERITQEFKKIFQSDNYLPAFQILKSTRLLSHIWPELTFHLNPDLWSKFLRGLNWLAPIRTFEACVALILIFESVQTQKPFSEMPFVLARTEKNLVHKLITGFFLFQSDQEDYLMLLNEESGPLITELCAIMAEVGHFSKALLELKIDRFLTLADENGALPEPFLDGHDLINLGVPQNQIMKELLKDCYLAQINKRLKTKKEAQDWVLLRLKS